MSILIFAAMEDIHARAVAWCLNRANIATYIVSTINFPSNGTLTIDLSAHPNSSIVLEAANDGGAAVNAAEVTCCWRRRMMVGAAYYDFSALLEVDLDGVVSETQGFLNNYFLEMRQIFGDRIAWVNKFGASSISASKYQQLKVAKSVGFAIPNTIMSNNPDRIRKFYYENSRKIILKPFYQQRWQDNGATFWQTTSLLNEDHLQVASAMQACPGIYQNYIEKKFELRVVVFGDEVVVAKLDSQSAQHTKVDWRLDALTNSMVIEPYELNAADNAKVLSLMKALDLRFGCLDFIVTLDDELVFLEVNEQGQFLFLDERCPELGVLSAMCQFLVKEAGLTVTCELPTFAQYCASKDNALRLAYKDLIVARGNQGIKFAFAEELG